MRSWLAFMMGAGTGVLVDRMVGRAKRDRVRRIIDAVPLAEPAPAPSRKARVTLLERLEAEEGTELSNWQRIA